MTATVEDEKIVDEELEDASRLPDPREAPETFWKSLKAEEVFFILAAAPKVAVWRQTKLGNLTLDAARPLTQAIGGINPEDPAKVEADAKAKGFSLANTCQNPRLHR